MELNINKKEIIDVPETEPSSETPFTPFTPNTGSEAIDILAILKDGVKADDPDEDLESEDLIIQFDFEAIETKSCFQLKDDESFEYSALLHKKSKEILIEPLVATYLNLKWQYLRHWWHIYQFTIFFTFGFGLTLMMSYIVEMNNHCNHVSIDTSKTELNNKPIETKTCLTVNGPYPNETCIFPFTYSGKRHEECTDEDHNQFWCPTEHNSTTDLTNYTHTVKWGNCGPDCKIEGLTLTERLFKQCNENNLSNLSIAELVKTMYVHQQNIHVAFFINVTITAYNFWTLYAFTAFGVILVTFAELSEAFRDRYKYFTYKANWLDFTNLFCAGLCLILTWTRYKDTAIWFGSTSVLFSWIIITLVVANMPIVGNWVYVLGNTVKKVITFLLVFMPLLFGFGLRFRFMFPSEVEGLAKSLYNAIFMLVNTFNYKVEDFGKNINKSSDAYEYMVKIGTYGTFIMALIVLTISFQNILIGLAVNLAKEAFDDAKSHRMWTMAQNLRGIRKFLNCCKMKLYESPPKAFIRFNRKSSKNIVELLKYWSHIWNESGRKLGLFWNAVVLGEHLVYNNKQDAMHQGTIIGTIPVECIEDAILMLKARKEEREIKKKEEENQKIQEENLKAEIERERILELLENLIALQKK